MKEVNDNELGKIISKNEKLLVVDFFSDSCPACVAVSKIFPTIEKNYDSKVSFLSYNVSENNKFSREFSIMGLPSILIIKNGKVMGQFTGLVSKLKIEGMINKYL